MKKVFIILGVVWLGVAVANGPARAQEDDFFTPDTEAIPQPQPVQGPAPGVICTDPNDMDTCYSDPDYDLKELLEGESGLSEEPTVEEQKEAQKAMTFEIRNISGQLNPLRITGPEDILAVAINVLMAFIGSISLILYIYAGFLWMSAGGNTEKVTRAKSILVWTTLGIIAMGASYLIVRVVLETVG